MNPESDEQFPDGTDGGGEEVPFRQMADKTLLSSVRIAVGPLLT
jgi:hypothetical protein